MQLFEGYSAEELERVLTTSRWVAGLLLLLGFAALCLNHWLIQRIASQQKLERDSGRSRLIAAEEEVRRLRGQMSSVANSVERLTSTRRLSATQVTELKAALSSAEKGRLIVTYLTIEWDAEDYAHQLAKILKEAGYEVTLSDHLWVEFKQSGLFLTSKDGTLPSHAQGLQRAFLTIGVDVPAAPPDDIAKELELQKGDAVLVVSRR
jgi:hypothetical protein